MISVLFEKPYFKEKYEYLNLSQNEGIIGRNRWYCGYVDTPDKRIGRYKIVIVLQKTLLKTLVLLLHELMHILINIVYGEGEIGSKIHDWSDRIYKKIKQLNVSKGK